MKKNKLLFSTTKIQALNIQPGDKPNGMASLRIIAYFKNKMQICTVKYVSNSDKINIKLSVFIGEHYRYSGSSAIQFKFDTLVNLVN